MASNPDTNKEFLINEKIEQIKKKNEEIRLRHLEVLEDKKNADAFSASEATRTQPVTHVRSTVKPPAKEKPVLSTQLANRSAGRLSRSLDQENATTQPRSSGKIHSNFTEGDGPPPDPGYSFLADDERDAPRIEIKDNRLEKNSHKANETVKVINVDSKPKQKRNAFSSTPKAKKENRVYNIADQNWRSERAAIDEARIQRQKTVEGNWRRAWDSEKVDDEVRNLAVSREHKLPYKYNEYSGRNVALRKPSFTRTVVFSSCNDHTSECSTSDKGGRGSADDITTNAMPSRHVVLKGENLKMSVNGAYVSLPAKSFVSPDIYNAFENLQVQRVANNELSMEGAANLICNRSKLRPLSNATKMLQSGQKAGKVYGIIKGNPSNESSSKVYNDGDDSWDDCSEEDP